MNTDTLPIVRTFELFKKRRLWSVGILLLFLLGWIVRQPLVFLVALFALIVVLLPELWYRYALRHLVVRQHISQQRLLFGEEVTVALSVENQKLLPLPLLSVENAITPLLTLLNRQSLRREKRGQLSATWLLWSFQRITRRYSLCSQARGLYTFGPIKLRASDPFGWVECEVTLPLYDTLLVYPLVVPLDTLSLSLLSSPLGDHALSYSLFDDPLKVVGIRDYQLGDDPRRLHWKATARAGALQSKIYEQKSLRRLVLLLDTENYSKVWFGSDRDIQEFSIAIAASLAVWALDEGYTVGLLTNSAARTTDETSSRLEEITTAQTTMVVEHSKDTTVSLPGVSVPFAHDEMHYERLLSVLAKLVPSSTCPIRNVLEEEDAAFSSGTTMILICATTTLTEATIEYLLHLQRRGVAIHLALIGSGEEKIPTEIYGMFVHRVGGSEKWHELIQAANNEAYGAVRTNVVSLQLD